MRPCFIVNELAGKGKTKRHWLNIQRYLQNAGIEHEVRFTTHPTDATEIAKQAADSSYTHVIAVGGDGTIHEVVNGLVGQRAVFGMIPSGTGNDLARMFDLPRDPIQAVEKILHGEATTIDLLEMNGTYVSNVVGLGFDAAVAKDINTANWKKRAGRLGYVLSVVKMLFAFRPFTLQLELDDQNMVFEGCWLVAIGNAKYYGGGMQICPDAKMDDGLLDVCVVNNLTRLQLLRLFPTVFSGKHVHLPQVAYMHGKRVRVKTDTPVHIQGNGELLGTTPAAISIRSAVLRVVH